MAAELSHIDLPMRHRVVSMLARGQREQRIADATTLPIATIRRIATEHGAPDLGRLADAAEAMTQALAKQKGEKPEVPAALRVIGDARALGGRLATRAEDLLKRLDELRVDVAAEVEKRQRADAERIAREKYQAELAEAVARVAELRKQAHLPNKEIRAWAAANGVACPAMGKVPGAVVEQWRAAVAS